MYRQEYQLSDFISPFQIDQNGLLLNMMTGHDFWLPFNNLIKISC